MNNSMIFANIKRELWEYKKTLVWVPAVIAILVIVFVVFALFKTEVYQFERIEAFLLQSDFTSYDQSALTITAMIFLLFMPFISVLFIVQFSYFSSCLFDERRDLSILFWRSLPVSDALSIGIKLLVGAIILPIVFLVAASVLLLFLVVVAAIGTGLFLHPDIPIWDALNWANIFTNVVFVWAHLFLIAIWLFPVYAWLILVSAFAKNAPLLWVFLPIVLIFVLEFLVEGFLLTDVYLLSDVLRDYFEIWNNDEKVEIQLYSGEKGFVIMEHILGKLGVLPVIVGCVFLYGAYWLRANRGHI